MEENNVAVATTPIPAYVWGLTPQKELPYWWGARAIYKAPDGVDILWDRQQLIGGTEKERKVFVKWLDTRGLKLLRKRLREEYVGPNENFTITVKDEKTRTKQKFFISANPKSSYGYLYICAGPIVEEEKVKGGSNESNAG